VTPSASLTGTTANGSGAGTSPLIASEHARLGSRLEDQVEGIRGLAEGQSNPAYRVCTPAHIYVPTRKPMGPLLPRAHPVEREFGC
jgi:hypothetical protein